MGTRLIARCGAIAAACVAAVSMGAGVARAADTTGFPSGPGNPGIFTERCGFSHEAADDPILMPGMTGMSMQHDFFGNVATNASSTASSLRGGQTTCRTSADASAYWIPQLYQNGRALTPRSALIYWQRPKHDTSAVHSLPAGLEMIAGDERATAPQGIHHVAWSCVDGHIHDGGPALYPVPRNCAPNEHVRLTVRFPSCWNGRSLNGANQTNVAYRTSNRAGCPAAYPVQIPEIVFHVVYPTSSAAGLAFSMGPHMTGSTDTAHVDFIDGWNASVLSHDVNACIATSTRCGPVKGPEATPQGPRSDR